jgi:YegS/Rv2252/BmrU family lipid kinase
MSKEIKKVHVIINPVSGAGSKARVVEMITSRCLSSEVALDLLYTERMGHATELARKAIDAGADCVIAVGGDGTVNEIAKTLLHSDVALGIIPKGSGNGLARELNIPMDTRGAVDVIFANHYSVIDACKANDMVFFCTCGVGFDATISAEFAKETHRGSLAYVKAFVEEYLNYSPEVYEVHIDDHTIKEKAFLIACANASQYGNNAFIAPHADVSDGQMDVTILSPFTAMDIGALAFQMFTKTLDKSSKIKTYKTRTAHISLQKDGVMHVDGESVKVSKEIELSVIRSALKVLTPANLPFVYDMQRRFNEVIRFFAGKGE